MCNCCGGQLLGLLAALSETNLHSGHFAASWRAWLIAHSLMQSKLRGQDTYIQSRTPTSRFAHVCVACHIHFHHASEAKDTQHKIIAGTKEARLCSQSTVRSPGAPLTRIDVHTLPSSCTLGKGTLRVSPSFFPRLFARGKMKMYFWEISLPLEL